MDNDKSQGLSRGDFHANFPHSWDAFGINPEPSPSSSSLSQLPPMPMPPHLAHASGSGPDVGHLSHDLSRMTDNPSRALGHRRAHSEILLTLSNDFSFDTDLGVGGGGPSRSDEVEEDLLSIYLDMDRLDSSAMSSFHVGDNSTSASAAAAGTIFVSGFAPGNSSFEVLAAAGPSQVIRHQQSQSMDGTTIIENVMLMSGSDQRSSPSPRDLKKAMSTAKLAKLALVDPKRAKRIWANRQSAARSKERKTQYIGELERKVQSLKTEAASLSAQVVLLQRGTNGLTAENNELKLRLQTMEHHVHLQDVLNDALKEEIVHLKVLTGQAMPNGGSVINFSAYESGQQYHPNSGQAIQTLETAHQFQQLQIHSQTQLQQQQQQQQQFQQQHHHLHQLQQRQPQQLKGSMPSAGQNDGNAADSPSVMKD